jgi:uncharacterized protein (TIGR00106 family)
MDIDRGAAVIAAFSITPLGGGASVSAAVAEAVRLVRESGLANETNAMFTNVEGDWDEVMGLIKACTDAVAAHADRVSLVIKVDHRPGVTDGLTSKLISLEAQLAGDEGGGPAPGAVSGAGPARSGPALGNPRPGAEFRDPGPEVRDPDGDVPWGT